MIVKKDLKQVSLPTSHQIRSSVRMQLIKRNLSNIQESTIDSYEGANRWGFPKCHYTDSTLYKEAVSVMVTFSHNHTLAAKAGKKTFTCEDNFIFLKAGR